MGPDVPKSFSNGSLIICTYTCVCMYVYKYTEKERHTYRKNDKSNRAKCKQLVNLSKVNIQELSVLLLQLFRGFELISKYKVLKNGKVTRRY